MSNFPLSPSRYEKTLRKHARKTQGFSEALADAANRARASARCETGHEKQIRNLAADVIAPVLVSFVMWVLHQARQRGIERLYFLSRDGQTLRQIADRLIDKNPQLRCETRYLYVSRQSVGRACIAMGSVDDSWIWSDTSVSTGEQMLERLGTSLSEVAPDLSEQEVLRFKQQPIPDAVTRMIREDILPYLKNGYRQSTEGQRDLAVAYLQQEGIGQQITTGLVDVGWKGSIHAMINQIARRASSMSPRPLWGGFFGLVPSDHGFGAHREAFYFDTTRGQGHDPLGPGPSIYGLMEAFCAADHGTVTGYHRNVDDEIVPLLESTWAGRMKDWGLPVVRDTLKVFLDAFATDVDFHRIGTAVRAPLTEIITQFWCHPNVREARAFGQFPRELGQGEEIHSEPFATPYRWRDVPTFARHGRDADKDLGHHYTWHEGSMMITPQPVRDAIRAVLGAGRAIRRCSELLTRRWSTWYASGAAHVLTDPGLFPVI